MGKIMKLTMARLHKRLLLSSCKHAITPLYGTFAVEIDLMKKRKSTSEKVDLTLLEEGYRAARPGAERLLRELSHQMTEILGGIDATLGFPISSRVKDLQSVLDKAKSFPKITNVQEFQDLVGFRIVLLYLRDVATVKAAIRTHFNVEREYDTQERLGDDRFGYSSYHFVVRLKPAWLALPTFSGLDNWQVEIQLRTVAQHIWAEASHRLQYKRLKSVPPAIRRTINRVSALLETVDLEFERVLDERQEYRHAAESKPGPAEDRPLDVDLLEKTLDRLLPSANKDVGEDYDEALNELAEVQVQSEKVLEKLIRKHTKSALQYDRTTVQEKLKEIDEDFDDPDTTHRLRRGVFFTHLGLLRKILANEYGYVYRPPDMSEDGG